MMTAIHQVPGVVSLEPWPQFQPLNEIDWCLSKMRLVEGNGHFGDLLKVCDKILFELFEQSFHNKVSTQIAIYEDPVPNYCTCDPPHPKTFHLRQLNTSGKLYNFHCLQNLPAIHLPLMTVVQPWWCSAFQRSSGWHSSHVRVLWTYLCRIWEHFILINIIHALVYSFGGASLPPPPPTPIYNPTPRRIAELSKAERESQKVRYCNCRRRQNMWGPRAVSRNPSDKCESTLGMRSFTRSASFPGRLCP